MVKHMASKNKWPVSPRHVFSNNITSVVWQNGWFIAEASMRTKSSGTVSTASSCSIDLPVGHGPPFSPPRYHPSLQLNYASGLYMSSHSTKPVEGGYKSITSLLLVSSIRGHRQSLVWGQNTMFQSVDAGLRLTQSTSAN